MDFRIGPQIGLIRCSKGDKLGLEIIENILKNTKFSMVFVISQFLAKLCFKTGTNALKIKSLCPVKIFFLLPSARALDTTLKSNVLNRRNKQTLRSWKVVSLASFSVLLSTSLTLNVLTDGPGLHYFYKPPASSHSYVPGWSIVFCR